MTYRKGDRVRHPTLEDWGLGEVLDDSNGDRVRVFFVGVGEKTLKLGLVAPVKVEGPESRHPVLDNLKVGKPSSGIRYQSLAQSIQYFSAEFPNGFYGDRFRKHERGYKEAAHAQGREQLGEEALAALLAAGDHAEIVKRALKLVNATNMIFPNEKMALKDGLQAESAQGEFSRALFAVLYGKENIEQRFAGFCSMLENVNAAKWTTATYFLFMVHPDQHMFVKPTITQYAAELCGFEINYKPQLNWLTYKSVLEFSRYLFREIAELRPRDMIDVQSFLWCIAPGTYRTA